jgi:hypothetical protein
MYISSIIWLLTWPLIIFVSYELIRLALKKYEKLNGGGKHKNEPGS